MTSQQTAQYLNAKAQAMFHASSTVQFVRVPLHFKWWAVRGHTLAPLYRRHSKYRFCHQVPGHPDQACCTRDDQVGFVGMMRGQSTSSCNEELHEMHSSPNIIRVIK